jgi:hypothetical protein
LGSPSAKTVGHDYDSQDLKVNSNTTESVTIVFVVGEAAIEKATNIAKETEREIDVNCCVKGNITPSSDLIFYQLFLR